MIRSEDDKGVFARNHFISLADRWHTSASCQPGIIKSDQDCGEGGLWAEIIRRLCGWVAAKEGMIYGAWPAKVITIYFG